ncbi:MMPL family transporter [Microbacterium sp. YY-01]|uniref:MMPL family transporter n=1 Tax=Microbacterium sp. YY-01 TaxID=3421634 RepID=UPI003D17B9DA
MDVFDARRRFSDRLTSRRGAWVALGVTLLGFIVLFGLFSGASAPVLSDQAPADSESAQAAALLKDFPDADKQSVLLVASRTDGSHLTDADRAGLERVKDAVRSVAADDVSGPIMSEDEEAAVMVAPITVGDSNSETATVLADVRASVAEAPVDGVTIFVTGGPAFGADIAAAFDGADFTLLAVTILIVAVLLIVTYRSPVLWLLPLTIVALADGAAGRVTAAAAQAWNLQFDAGIISVLVFGAGTNYALLLISRYREELERHENHRDALSSAWRATVPAIVASNLTVVIALLSLALAVIPGTRGLGVSSALGLVLALAAVLFGLPPLLAVCGRRVFWPFIPRPGGTAATGRVWRRVATGVVRRPVISAVAGLALLGVMAAGLIGTTVGLDQMEKFRVQSESATGLEVLAEHFPAGEAQPVMIVARSGQADEVVEAVRDVSGVVRAHPAGTNDSAGLTSIMVTGEYAPGTPESLAQIAHLRDAAHSVADADARVGGAVATDVDARAGNVRDLWVVAPLVIVISFIVLTILLRSLVAPVLLLVVNVLSAVAAIGAGAWLSRMLFDQPALDLQVPLLSFLFLVALGIDYTIFLVHRARTEAAAVGTREGMIRAVAGTGSVITSAGLVLAGVFAALGVLPLVTLGQLGLIVGVGVVVDTIVVRTIIVPALFSLLGDTVWWPKNPRRVRVASGASQQHSTESNHEHRRSTSLAR